MPRPKISDVARVAGVSRGTVSHVLNHPEVVADGTREKVLAAISELGFVRNDPARQLRAGRSQTIGMQVLDVKNPIFAELLLGVEHAVAEKGYVVMLCNSGSSMAGQERHLRAFEERRVEGVLIAPVSTHHMQTLDRLRSQGTAVVLLTHHAPSDDQCSTSVDDVAGGGLAAQHLIALGHERVALINGPSQNQQPLADRRAGFLRSLQDVGLDLPREYDIEIEAGDIASGEEAMAKLFDRVPPPTAVFCGNDLIALGALRAALQRGLRVPDDLAIVGYDDIELAALATVPLTSVRQPSYQLGQQAARMLIDEAENAASHVHRRLVYDPELVVRHSTVRPAR